MGKGGHIQSQELAGKWGPLPSWGPPLSKKEEEQARAAQALLRLKLDAHYYLAGELHNPWVPSSREDFERALAEFHQMINRALIGRGEPSYLQNLADRIAIFEERKDPPPLPRGERTTIVLGECFVQLWTEGENWVTRKGFFDLVCAELKNQGYAPITYHHFVRILKGTGLDEYLPPIRRRRKRQKRKLGFAHGLKGCRNVSCARLGR